MLIYKGYLRNTSHNKKVMIISNRLFTDHFMPLTYRQLRGNDQGSFTVPVFNDLHQGSPALSIKGLDSEVVKYQQLLALNPGHFSQTGKGLLKKDIRLNLEITLKSILILKRK